MDEQLLNTEYWGGSSLSLLFVVLGTTNNSLLNEPFWVGLCLGFVTESNKPFIRFGVTGTDIKEHHRSYQKK